jgi:hypothetical protein
MIKLPLFILAFLTFSTLKAQNLTSILNGTFVEGITGVNNTISAENLFGDEVEAVFYLTSSNYQIAYDSYSDTDVSDGFVWDLDMGNLVPDAIIWVEFYDVSGTFLIDTYDSPLVFNIIQKPHWLISGSVNNVIVDASISTISFDGIYPIFALNEIIDASIKGIGNRPLEVVGEFIFSASYNYTNLTSIDVSSSSANLNFNLLDQKNYSETLDMSGSNCSLNNNFNLSINANQVFESPEMSFKSPKIKFPLGISGVNVSIDAGLSLYATLTGQIVIGEQNGIWGFINNGNETTRIVGLLNGKAFIRGEMTALAGAVKVSGSIKGDARLGIGFEYQNLPSEVSNSIFGGEIHLYGQACYKTLWGIGPSKCVNSDDWYSDYFGDLSIFNKSTENEQLLNFDVFTFQDTGTLILPDFHPQPSFGTRGDTLYAVWLEHDQYTGYILFSKLDNSINEFTDEIIVTTNSNSISNPKVAILPSGSAIITWSQNRYNDITLPLGSDEFDILQAQDVWFAIYDQVLDSIVHIQKLDDDESSAQSGRAEGEAFVTVGDDNDAMITWVTTDAIASTSDIFYTHLTETADSWYITTPSVLSDLTGVNSSVGVVYTDSAAVLTVWINDPDGDEETYNSNMVYSEWDGTSWTPAQYLTTNDGSTKLNELSLASNDGYVAFAWTSSHFDTNNEFENSIDMMVYDAVIQEWDLSSSFNDTDSNYYFQLPITSISNSGKATICYQVINMYADTNYIPNGELYLYVKDLNAGGNWQEITENSYLCDTSTFIWDLTAGFASNDRYYTITQEYNDNGVVTNPINGVKFGDPDLSLVLRGMQLNSNNSIGDIEEPGNVSSGIKEINNRLDFRFINSYPNPFSDITVIEYQIENNANVQMEIFDFMGNKVADLVNSNLNAGIYKTVFKAGDLQGGVYINKLTVNGKTLTKKLVLIK